MESYLLDLHNCFRDSVDERTVGESVIGGLDMGPECGPGENRFATRRHAAPEGCLFVRCGISDQYAGKAEAHIGADRTTIEITSLSVDGQGAKYRWWAAYVAAP